MLWWGRKGRFRDGRVVEEWWGCGVVGPNNNNYLEDIKENHRFLLFADYVLPTLPELFKVRLEGNILQ